MESTLEAARDSADKIAFAKVLPGYSGKSLPIAPLGALGCTPALILQFFLERHANVRKRPTVRYCCHAWQYRAIFFSGRNDLTPRPSVPSNNKPYTLTIP
jgi:hypothetical protein